MTLSFPPPFRLGDQDITLVMAASRPQEVERKIWLYWMQYGVMPPAFPCGILFRGGVFDPPLGTEVRIPDDWERCLERIPEEWYDPTVPVEPWQNNPLRSERAQRRVDYAQAMLQNEIDPVRTHWYGHPSPTGDRYRVGRPSPPRGRHERQPSYYGARQSPLTQATPSKSSKIKSQTMDRKDPAQTITNFSSLATVPEAGSPRVMRRNLPLVSVNLRGHRRTRSVSQIATFLDSSSPGSSETGPRTPTKIPAPAPTVPSTSIPQRRERSYTMDLSSPAVAPSPATNTPSSSATSPSPLNLRQRSQTLTTRGLSTADTEHDPPPHSPTPASRERHSRNVSHFDFNFDDLVTSTFGRTGISDTGIDRSRAATGAANGGGDTSENTGSGSSNTRNTIPGYFIDMHPSPPSSSDDTEVDPSDLHAGAEQSQAPRLRTFIEHGYSEAWGGAFAKPSPRHGGRE